MTPGGRLAGLGRLVRRGPGREDPPKDLDLATMPEADRRIVEQARPLTMTDAPKIHALLDAVRYCVRRGVPGAFAECGVWRGGSVLAMILTLQEMGVEDREIWLYDTFEGMTAPTEHDVSPLDAPALQTWEEARARGEQPWSFVFRPEAFNEEAVREVLAATGYPPELLRFVTGPVEETLPTEVPSRLALLRLDTDWYESTRHELEHLYPVLSDGGVLIVDDYGHWEGCRRAVDEYFAGRDDPVLLARVDYTARLAIKH